MTMTPRATSDVMRPARHRGTAAWWAVLALSLYPAGAMAHADTGNRAAAEELFKVALGLIDAGSWDLGCPKFEQSLALYPSRSTMIRIARCRAHEGKLASAWKDYRRAIEMSSAGEDPERQRQLVEIAAREAQALEPRLPRLRVVIKDPPGAEVHCDGVSIPTGAQDSAAPLDAGQHEVTARAAGYRTETRSVLLQEGTTTTLEMSLSPSRRAASWLMPAGITFSAAGLIGLGVGAVSGVTSLQLAGAVRERCGGVHCASDDDGARQDVNQAKTFGDLSTASFITGAALAVTGGALLVLHFTSRDDQRTGEAPPPALQLGLGPGQITLQGRF